LIYKDHLGTLYYLSNAEGLSIDNFKVSRVVFRTGATIEGDFIAGHRWMRAFIIDPRDTDDVLQIKLLSGNGTLLEDGLKFEFSVESDDRQSQRIVGNGQLTYTMFKLFFGQSGNIESLHCIQPDWIFDGQIDNLRINAKVKTSDDRFRLIVDYTPDDNTGYKSCWISFMDIDFKVEFLGEKVFTGNGNPFYCSNITGDGFCLHPSNNFAVITNPTENGPEITNIWPGMLNWTESKDQHGTTTTKRCTAGGQHYYENI